ncbi:tetratricopeptide repeat protein [Litoribaculum gwangyangense]|uniref:Tetratricopeptide repeat protein n=1 Tax=Litoribaculum gwangyangense TaxID=1130722 RepID=A0ABP9BVV2_9FLAO
MIRKENLKMKIAVYIMIAISAITGAQNTDKLQLLTQKKANNYVYEGNNLLNEDDFVSAEMEYRKAISEKPTSVAGTYNLGNAYYSKGNLEEALYRHQQAAETAISKSEKHMAFHNIGNILMKNKQCKEAVEAYKNALRNDPTDEETRYNLGIAKECAEQQQDQNKDDNKEDKQDENKENQDQKDNQEKKDKEGENKDQQDKKDEGDQDKKEGEDQKDDEGKPKDEKEDKGKGDEEKKDQKPPKPQPGQLSPQQIKNLLEAMNNQEQKVQEKINAEKQKGVKVKTEKDW